MAAKQRALYAAGALQKLFDVLNVLCMCDTLLMPIHGCRYKLILYL